MVQQSKARHKEDFPLAFAPVIAEAVSITYKGATADVQNKVRRVVEVWRDRSVFQEPIQAAIESRIDGKSVTFSMEMIHELMRFAGLDKARGAGKNSASNATIGGPSVPSELMPLLAPASAVAKLALSSKVKSSAASMEYAKNTDPEQPTPSENVFAARLNGLMKSLAIAEGAVAECVKTRKDLITALEKLLDNNKAVLEGEEKQLAQLMEQTAEIKQKKQDVETEIMRGLADQESVNRGPKSASPKPELERPEVEALTPPAIHDDTDFYEPEPASGYEPMDTTTSQPSNFQPAPAGGLEALSTLASQYSAVPVAANGINKKRKVENGDEFPELGNVSFDPEIEKMIRE